jgi:A/G-specific adenine glycosylase
MKTKELLAESADLTTKAISKKLPTVQDLKLGGFIATVLDFYVKYGRHQLAWRKNITAYRVLVSEIMLQQTQVARVLPKYDLWLKHYPTLKRLSVASLSEVLLLWQGLGYQRRVKALLSIAQSVSVLPKTFDELRELPGIGEYTASAIMAFAWDIFDTPVLETNIRTVLIEHFFKRKKEIRDDDLKEILKKLSMMEEVQKVGARNWYYALMDYGAYLKSKSISHNEKVRSYKKQTKFKGSQRELRAKVLFAITQGFELPKDNRINIVLGELLKEGFIKKINSSYLVV